jgi:hypothetical protein
MVYELRQAMGDVINELTDSGVYGDGIKDSYYMPVIDANGLKSKMNFGNLVGTLMNCGSIALASTTGITSVNNLPLNSVAYVSSSISNIPVSNTACVVLTIKNVNGAVQVAFVLGGSSASLKWRSVTSYPSGTWTAWK